jgi:hypothetical protein
LLSELLSLSCCLFSSLSSISVFSLSRHFFHSSHLTASALTQSNLLYLSDIPGDILLLSSLRWLCYVAACACALRRCALQVICARIEYLVYCVDIVLKYCK